MRLKIIYLILIALSAVNTAKSQVDSIDSPIVLEKLFERLVNSYEDTDRLRINDSIRSIIDSYVTSDTVFTHRFGNLRYLGQITSPDSLIKIITWNLILKDIPGRYYCYFISKREQDTGNKVHRLTASYHESPVMTDTVYYEPDWYGALYYDIRPCVDKNSKCWVLLGIDYGNPLTGRKIIDVLNFNNEGSIVFGRKWFASGKEMKFREVFEYASTGIMSLRFSSDTSIVFNHLVTFSPDQKDDHQFYGPDYSYDAYNFENGIWVLNINVDIRNKE